MNYIEATKGCMGGKLRLKGHRITVAQIVAEIAREGSLSAIADNYDLEVGKLRGMLDELSCVLANNPMPAESNQQST